MTGYEDMLYLPHHVSATRVQMPIADRAAQFSPFAALTGYEEAIDESARLTQEWIELDESEKERLNVKLQQIKDLLPMHPQVILTYFEPDKKKQGGAYLTAEGKVKKIDEWKGVFILEDGREILIEQLVEVNICGENLLPEYEVNRK